MENAFSFALNTLIKEKIPNPRLETRIMLAEITGCSPSEINDSLVLSPKQRVQLEKMLSLRQQNCPLDKIIGHREFYKYNFITSTDVLSPRPDTEILVEEAATLIKTKKIDNILDLGVGSGCIIGSLLADFPELHGVGIDISAKALQIAETNIKKLNVINRCALYNYDYCDDIFPQKIREKFGMIVANPPYIPSDDIKNLSDEVKNFDPIIALDGGNDGLKYYKKIAEISPQILHNNGYALLEIGLSQENDVAEIFALNNFRLLKTVKDLSGINRCLIFQKNIDKYEKS